MDQELPILPEHLSSPPVLSGVRVSRALFSFMCMCFLRSLFVLLSFFLWPLRCLSFFDLGIRLLSYIYIASVPILKNRRALFTLKNHLGEPNINHDDIIGVSVCPLSVCLINSQYIPFSLISINMSCFVIVKIQYKLIKFEK